MNHFELEPEENEFQTLFVDLTHRCNMACANCYIPNRTIPDMNEKALFEFAARLPNRVTFRLIGGEPTLRKDLPEIIRRLHDLGHATTLFTNGLRLESGDLVKSLKEAGLNRIQLSMNGGSLDSVYEIIDQGKVAERKIRALQNLIANQIITSVGMIVCGEVSIPAIQSMIPLIEKTYSEHAPRKDKMLLIPTLRFRSIGRVGRYMNAEMSFEELATLTSKALNHSLDKFEYAVCGSDFFRSSSENKTRSIKSKISSTVGLIHVKITDWKVDDDGVIEAGNRARGRITKNWKVAPFFEDIKINEFGY